MSNKKNIDDEIIRFEKLDKDPSIPLEGKLDELIALLAQSNLDTETVKKYQKRVNDAFEHTTTFNEYIDPFNSLEDNTLSREDMLDKMSVLLSQHNIDSKTVKKQTRTARRPLQMIVQSIIGLLLVVLGFAMIVMPAPQSFEIYTVFYFNPQDGVTIMDIISLLIVFVGIYLLIISLTKYRSANIYEG